MYVSTSNALVNRVGTVITGSSGDDAANITNPDFSTGYTSSNNTILTISFGAVSSVSYVGIAGIRLKGAGDETSGVKIYNGNTLIAETYIARDNVITMLFEQLDFTNLIVEMINPSASELPAVRYIAAGQSMQIPNDGEIAGYNRLALNRATLSRTTTNSLAAPIAILTKKTPLAGVLSFPNMLNSWARNDWQFFLDFVEGNLFFVRETDIGSLRSADQSYVCFNPKNSKTTAHAKTRALQNVSLGFTAYIGL